MTAYDQLRHAWRIEGLIKRAVDMNRRNFLRAGVAGALGVKGATPAVKAAPVIARAATLAEPAAAGLVAAEANVAPLTRRQLLGSGYRGAQAERLLQLTKARMPLKLSRILKNPVGAAIAGGVGLVGWGARSLGSTVAQSNMPEYAPSKTLPAAR